MHKRAKLFILLILLISLWSATVYSQEISHDVLLPAASVVETSSVSYSQTIGETAVVIVSSPEYVLTQGFQQPRMDMTTKKEDIGNGVEVFPNPAIDNLTVKLFGGTPRDFRIDIINIAGTIVVSRNLSFPSMYNYEEIIPVSDLMRGIYLVRVISSDKVISRTFKINKM